MMTPGPSKLGLARLGAGLQALLLGVSTMAGCAPHDAPGLCRSQGECDKSTACIVGRCRPRAEPPVLVASRRVVLEPTEVAILSSRQAERIDPSTIGFGRASAGDVVMLLAFDDALGSEVELEAAFLVLEPADGAPTPYAAVPIEVSGIREAWSRESVSWGRQPSIGLPETVADATPRARSSLRIDVTRLFGSVAARHGIAVLAKGKDPIGAFYATGLGAGIAPRLELYLKTTPSAAPSASASAGASASASASASAAPAPSGRASVDATPPDAIGKRTPSNGEKPGARKLPKKPPPVK